MNTVKAVDHVVNNWNRREELKKLQKERDAIDKQIADISNNGVTDTTPKF
jgi:hypothetical protein